MKWWDQMPWSWFSECWALSQLFHSPLSLSSRGVRKHLTGDFLCAVLDLSGILYSLLIPEYSGIKSRGKPFPGGWGIQAFPSLVFLYGDKHPLPFYEPYGKSDYLQPSLFDMDCLMIICKSGLLIFISAENSYFVRQCKYLYNVE